MRRRKATSYLALLLALILAAVYLFPVYVLFINSFKTQKAIYIDVIHLPQQASFTWQNYPVAMEKIGYWRALFNSLLISVSSVLLLIVLCSMAAWALVRNKWGLSSVLFMLFAASILIPFQTVMLPLLKTLGQVGLTSRLGLVIANLGFGASMTIILFHGFIKNVPLELEEAARIDGCSSLRTFWQIVFPLLKNITITAAIINVMWIWNDYLLPSLIINKPQTQTLPLRTFFFFGQFSKRWDLGTAGLILGMVPIILFYLLAQKHIIKGVAEGAIK